MGICFAALFGFSIHELDGKRCFFGVNVEFLFNFNFNVFTSELSKRMVLKLNL